MQAPQLASRAQRHHRRLDAPRPPRPRPPPLRQRQRQRQRQRRPSGPMLPWRRRSWPRGRCGRRGSALGPSPRPSRRVEPHWLCREAPRRWLCCGQPWRWWRCARWRSSLPTGKPPSPGRASTSCRWRGLTLLPTLWPGGRPPRRLPALSEQPRARRLRVQSRSASCRGGPRAPGPAGRREEVLIVQNFPGTFPSCSSLSHTKPRRRRRRRMTSPVRAAEPRLCPGRPR